MNRSKSKSAKRKQDKDNLSDWSEDSIEVESKDKGLSSFFSDLIDNPMDKQTAARSQAHKNKIKEDVKQHTGSQGLKTSLEQKIQKVKARQEKKVKLANKKMERQQAEAGNDDDEDLFASGDEEGGAAETTNENSQAMQEILNMEEIKDDEEEEEEGEKNGESIKAKRGVSFSELNLIKPLLKACSDIGYAHATPIQKLAIPAVLGGRDVLASAVTGSGKTAAFLLPILQLYYNMTLSGKVNFNTTRALVILPTRELAMQCYEMFQSLNKYTRMSCSLVIGSSSMEKQRVELNRNPFLVIATPGRIIDHLHNSKNFDLDDVDMLVLDEADKLLELGFMYELEEVIKSINPKHQTLLFSATLSGKVNELVQLALKKPIRISANPDFTIARKLRQEVVKIKGGDWPLRDATLLKLTEDFTKRVIVFFKTKQACHRMAIIFGLLGLKAKELHGNLSQTERIEALEQFKDNKVNYLLSTDLAARGIDIKQVSTVINFELPSELTKYIHRVGRTARAGESGISITICDEIESKKMRQMIKQSKDQVFKREIDWNEVEQYKAKLDTLRDTVKKIFKMESYEKELMQAEQAAARAENMLKYQEEIYNRPKKTWIVSTKQKKDLLDKQRKLRGGEDDEDDDDNDDGGNNQSHQGNHQDLAEKIMGKKNKNNKFNKFKKRVKKH